MIHYNLGTVLFSVVDLTVIGNCSDILQLKVLDSIPGGGAAFSQNNTNNNNNPKTTTTKTVNATDNTGEILPSSPGTSDASTATKPS